MMMMDLQDRLIVVNFFPHNKQSVCKSVLNKQERISQNAQDDNIPQHTTTQYPTCHHLTLKKNHN
jgi:hypothetical protein